MPAGGPDRIVVVPPCAARCTYVQLLLEQLAEEHHTSTAQEAETHALITEPRPG